IKKSVAVPPEVVRKNLSAIIEKIALSSKRTWTFRGKKETDGSKIHMWNRSKTRQGGIIYEINRDHPLIESIYATRTTEKQIIVQMLTQIERSLPLNQLYVDLTSDERVVNDNEMSKSDILPLVKHMMAGCRSELERKEMATRLSVTEPFDQHPEWLTELMQEVE
ncbi:MAG: ATP-binding protein, partial [Bacilli bacterium]